MGLVVLDIRRLKWTVVLALIVLDIRRLTGRGCRDGVVCEWGGLRWRTWLMSWIAREEDGCGTALLFICSFSRSGVVRCNTLGQGIVETSAGSRYESPLQALKQYRLQALRCVGTEGEERISYHQKQEPKRGSHTSGQCLLGSLPS